MKTITATCESMGPLLMNPSTQDLLNTLKTGVSAPIPKDVAAEKIAERKLIMNPNGNGRLGIPADYLFAALNGAGRRIKDGKQGKLATATSSNLPGMLWIKDEFLEFPQSATWVTDQRRGRIPKEGTAVNLIRPMVSGWRFEVTLEVDEDYIATDTVLKLMVIAGRFIGVGDFRPSCKGRFGQFTVTKWVVDGQEEDISQKVKIKASEVTQDTDDDQPGATERQDLVGATAGGNGASARGRRGRTPKVPKD